MSEIRVVAAADLAEAPEESSPVAIGRPVSPMDVLRGKREALRSTLHLDLPVPRWEAVLGQRLWVRYRPGNPAVLATAIEKREKAHSAQVAEGKRGDPEWSTKAHADFLVAACEAVFALDPSVEVIPDDLDVSGYPQFGNPDLAEALEVGVRDAVEVCRAVYTTDGDLVVAAQQLANWSAKALTRADGSFFGS